MSRNIRIINHSMAYNGIIIILSLCITIQKEAKCSQNEMDNIEKLMKSHEGSLEMYDVDVENMKRFIGKLIEEIKANLTNHGVQFDEVIECRRMFYESSRGARTFSVQAESRNGSACYVNVPQQYIEALCEIQTALSPNHLQ
uniref:Secreted protein n=1 Tax=Schistosoma mansoni TaxID=6183 RepID=A0A5K4F9E7_SCHMA